MDGLTYDPLEACRYLAEQDPVMGDLIERAGPFELHWQALVSPFNTLMRSIVFQQLSTRVATAIHARLVALLPEDLEEHPEAILKLSDEQLRGAGLSRAKMLAVRDLAEKRLAGIVPDREGLLHMSDQEIIDHLVQVRGIGRWTVEMLLIFHLARPDVLPVHDLGIRKGYQLAYGGDRLPMPKELEHIGERWKPYRSVASWYLWRATDMKTPDN